MFRDRPLTALFIAATLIVNGVLFTTPDDSILLGLVLGQLAAVAIWSVRGRTHRLIRASCLAFATWGLFCLLPDGVGSEDYVWFSILSGYAFVIVVVTLLADYLHVRFRRILESAELNSRWQISLIECFGWTIVVSIISFGARLMSFQFLLEAGAVAVIMPFLAVPVAVSILVRRDLRTLGVVRAIGIAIVAVIAVQSSVVSIGSGGKYLIGIQTVYLVIWLAVLGMDDVFAKMKKVRQSLGKENSQFGGSAVLNLED